ncbi:MAG TPA: putative sulfate exporter family transporter [Thermomicrobiales bacterium]|nr:putative sulfate exporter family transporter [Thermomicrobiales bacterium]
MPLIALARRLLPGLALAAGITLLAIGIAGLETLVFGYPLLEPLVLALILGVVVRALWQPPAVFEPGIAFGAKQVLELAIVLIGVSLALGTLVDAGARLAVAILLLVSMTIALGVTLGRAAGLPVKLAVLIGVGNAICGNSAIAAVAPVIRARKQDVASAIALTAVLGIGVVLTLPLLVPLLAISDPEYGVVAGLSVYAVPQVLAATFPVSATAGQVASLVKLSRVLLLGPTVAILAILFRERDAEAGSGLTFSKLVPWFVIGFGIAVALRSAGLVPEAVSDAARESSRVLTAVAMAGLGLSVDIRSVRETGSRVALVVLGLTLVLVTSAVAITLVLDLP